LAKQSHDDSESLGNDTVVPVALENVPAVPVGALLKDRYELLEHVARGGTGDVYRAIDRQHRGGRATDAQVAVKLVTSGPGAAERLRREAEVLRGFRHPHIVRVVDFGADGDTSFMAMEWLEGVSLATLLDAENHRPLEASCVREIVAAVGDALQYAHAQGIVHADVKPSNIFVTTDGGVRLLDFGCCSHGHVAAEDAGNTPAYASCEVLEGATAAVADDVFSLACVTYRMLAGHRAFGHSDALAAEKAGRRPARVRSLTDAQWQVLERALAFRREERTADISTFRRAFLALTPAVAPPPAAPVAAENAAPAPAATPERAPRASRRNPIIAAIAVTLVAATIVAGLSGRDAPPAAPDAQPVSTSPPAEPLAQAPMPILRPPDPAALETPTTASAQSDPAPPVATAASRPATRAAPEPAAVVTTPSSAPARAQSQPEPPATALSPAPAPVDAQEARAPASSSPPAAAPESAAAGATASEAPQPSAAVIDPLPAATDSPPPAATIAATTEAPTELPAGNAAMATIDPVSDPGPPKVELNSLKFRRYVEPIDPRWTRGENPTGWVELAFTVAVDGRTRDIRVVESNPAGLYDQIALAAVRRWRFEPVMEGTSGVERRTGVRLRFESE
jgi:TonB family protein